MTEPETDPATVIARDVKRRFPHNPDVVCGREARLIMEALAAGGYGVVPVASLRPRDDAALPVPSAPVAEPDRYRQAAEECSEVYDNPHDMELVAKRHLSRLCACAPVAPLPEGRLSKEERWFMDEVDRRLGPWEPMPSPDYLLKALHAYRNTIDRLTSPEGVPEEERS